MIVVTGTKRSGTSMWMRCLIEAGLDHIGEAFPAVWEKSIAEANPHGFFESRFRKGVFFATNPDPKTGQYLQSSACENHVVKVFIPGVIRTERAYIRRVVATMRHWRHYSRSIEALYAKEEAYFLANPSEGKTGEQMVAEIRSRRPPTPAPVEWFMENFELVRDFSVRRYPIHFGTYEALLEDPEQVLSKVLDWIGHGDVAKAAAAVDPSLRRSATRNPVASELAIDDATMRLFDDFYDVIHTTNSIPKRLAAPLNETWHRLNAEYARKDARRAVDQDLGINQPGPELR